MTEFIMLVGLPASGKSTHAKILAEQGYKIFSSDEWRLAWFGDVNEQSQNQKLFKELYRSIKQSLKEGINCVLDATNISYKKRKAFLQELSDIKCKKICHFIITPYEECLERNSKRDKKVPEGVIKRMYFNFNIPYWYEGWDEIKLLYNSNVLDNKYYLGDIDQHINSVINFNQDNSHYQLTLGEHERRTNRFIQTEYVFNAMNINATKHFSLFLTSAAILHDCGKLKTKTFKNFKGEKTDDAHYYNHQYVGAYDSLFFEKQLYPWINNDEFDLEVAIRIMWHMQPYFNQNSSKADVKYRKLWGEELYNDIMLLHAADKAAH